MPVYKGGGKDPMDVNSYRGVALTTVVGKVLKFLILERLQAILLEAGIPHINQSAYRKEGGFLCQCKFHHTGGNSTVLERW